MEIRRANIEDIDLIAPLFDLYRQFYGQETDLNLAKNFIFERLKNNQSIIFLVFVKEIPVGFVQLYRSFSSVSAQPTLILNDLFVAEEARKSGLGRKLMNETKNYATEFGAKRLTLSTAITNLPAQKLYEDLGYELDQKYRHYSLELK
jgi:ribosomal protein S18 acetylase RimI-like enzyme